MSVLKQSNLQLYRRLWPYIRVFRFALLMGILANACSAGIDAGLTYMMRNFIEKGFFDVDLAYVKQIPIILLTAISLRGVVNALAGYSMTYVGRGIVTRVRDLLFAHLIRLPADVYDEESSGKMLSKVLYDVEQISQLSADAIADFVQNSCLLLGLLTVMFVLNWQLSLVFLTIVPLVALMISNTAKRVRKQSRRVQETMGTLTATASESFDGYRAVRIFGGTEYEQQKFHTANEQSRKNDMRVALSKAISTGVIQVILAAGIGLIIVAAMAMSKYFEVQAGAFIAIVAAMIQMLKPLKSLSNLHVMFERGFAALESVFHTLDKPIEARGGEILTKPIAGDIRLEKVSFAYRSGKPVLQQIDLHIPAGKMVALVGQSGSGKSTIASLIPRFYELTQGRILLDGEPISALSLESLRSHISMVAQHITLFNDSIANNIAYGMPHASRDAIVHAAKLAYADEFIDKLPQGFDTVVGDNGVLLSGGQRQRIAIARAMLKDAPILILDEATSALDTQSERAIQAALDTLSQNRTTLVVAHRLSTIEKADKIVVMQHGRIVASGTHQTLLEQSPYYHSLYQGERKAEISDIDAAIV